MKTNLISYAKIIEVSALKIHDIDKFPIFIFDDKLKVLFINNETKKFLGISQNEDWNTDFVFKNTQLSYLLSEMHNNKSISREAFPFKKISGSIQNVFLYSTRISKNYHNIYIFLIGIGCIKLGDCVELIKTGIKLEDKGVFGLKKNLLEAVTKVYSRKKNNYLFLKKYINEDGILFREEEYICQFINEFYNVDEISKMLHKTPFYVRNNIAHISLKMGFESNLDFIYDFVYNQNDNFIKL